MSDKYKQCRLSKNGLQQVSFIPEDIAVQHNVVKLKDMDGWELNWTVEEVFEPAMSYDAIQTAANQARNTRKASDV